MKLDSAVLAALARDPSPITVTFGSGNRRWARIHLGFDKIIDAHFQETAVESYDNVRYTWQCGYSACFGFEVSLFFSWRNSRWSGWSQEERAGTLILPQNGDIERDSRSYGAIGRYYAVETERSA